MFLLYLLHPWRIGTIVQLVSGAIGFDRGRFRMTLRAEIPPISLNGGQDVTNVDNYALAA